MLPFVHLLWAGPDGRPGFGEPFVAVVRNAATELFMTLALPRETLRLGLDLPAPPGDALWPDDLVRLEHPRLVSLTAEFGAYETRERNLQVGDRVEAWLRTRVELGRQTAQGSGAADWARLSDRMRYIFEYFRSRQRDASLLTLPFSAEQAEAIVAGRVPDGPL